MLELMHEANQTDHANLSSGCAVLSLGLVHAASAAANALSRSGVWDDVGGCGLHYVSYCLALKRI